MTPILFRIRKSAGDAARLTAALLMASAVLIAFSPPHAALAEMASNATGRAYLFRGLIGVVFSRGMDRLAERIRSAGIPASIAAFPSCRKIAAEAIRDYKRDPMPITLIGHSMGGRCALTFAEILRAENIPVSLVVTFDPARTSPHIPFNVERYINVFKSNDLLGAGDIPYQQGFPGHYASFNLAEHGNIVHINIDKIESLHKQLVSKILELPATPANVEGGIAPIRYRVPAEAPIELWDSGKPVFARAGDTLRTLAGDYKVPLWSLRQMNKTPDNAPLAKGQRIIVPRHLVPWDSSATGAPAKQTPTKR
jgi:hypothetical protein